MIKNLPATLETQVWFLGWEDPLEKWMATHSSILAWRIPWIEEPGRLQLMGLQRVGLDWMTNITIPTVDTYTIILYYIILYYIILYYILDLSPLSGMYMMISYPCLCIAFLFSLWCLLKSKCFPFWSQIYQFSACMIYAFYVLRKLGNLQHRKDFFFLLEVPQF